MHKRFTMCIDYLWNKILKTPEMSEILNWSMEETNNFR